MGPTWEKKKKPKILMNKLFRNGKIKDLFFFFYVFMVNLKTGGRVKRKFFGILN